MSATDRRTDQTGAVEWVGLGLSAQCWGSLAHCWYPGSVLGYPGTVLGCPGTVLCVGVPWRSVGVPWPSPADSRKALDAPPASPRQRRAGAGVPRRQRAGAGVPQRPTPHPAARRPHLLQDSACCLHLLYSRVHHTVIQSIQSCIRCHVSRNAPLHQSTV